MHRAGLTDAERLARTPVESLAMELCIGSPRTAMSRSIIASSSSVRTMAPVGTVPSIVFAARSRNAAILALKNLRHESPDPLP